MIHQPMSTFFESQTGDIVVETGELVKLRESLAKVYVQRTGKPDWLIAEDMERDRFMSAEEAKEYGIIDAVGAPVIL
jgi:ATP-dependent Clp protease, protease subunit